MLEFHIITAFPNFLESPLNESIIKRARERHLVSFHFHDIREYATDKHRKVDDYPYGGGAGMILKPEPIFRCIEDIYSRFDLNDTPVTLMSAAGNLYTQKKAIEFSLREKMVILCGHYKGIDERVIEHLVREEISIGDYILTGGELPAMVIIDSVVRLIPGAISDIDSAETDSFQSGLLDHPHYTRPEVFRDMPVPGILLSGNHREIEKWRRELSLERTKAQRQDLLQKYYETGA
jgi:tRNA (guanine37-N1)-methyltransferase